MNVELCKCFERALLVCVGFLIWCDLGREGGREEGRERKSERMEGEPERWRRGCGEGGDRECMVELMCVHA